MDQPMTKEESYAERRLLFKNIWDTAMHIDEKDPDIMSKPKVIKTLRLAEVDRCPAGKKKKQRIKNLRTVCNKILDFCDRQDADDLFYEQMAADGQEPLPIKIEEKPKKPKHVKNKVIRAKSMISPLDTQRRKGELLATSVNKTSRNTSPIKIKRTTIVRRTQVKRVKTKQSPTRAILETSTAANLLLDAQSSNANRRVLRKKVSRRKRPSNSLISPGSSVKYNNLVARVLGRTLCKPKQPLQLHKINI
ncbi:uncharacterized protein LOC115442146 [Manduca sexta]|uniref:Uncharacterized protein n=1 Tax=Manduca sexta TaxID=7130 RepID=A0A921YZK6_MANSE|nr:uncharacterized protein LOC115442146 [Manduca sexta]KAG6448080.1 hypothetical protein O3G_MSEX005310 [Manduca sexta]